MPCLRFPALALLCVPLLAGVLGCASAEGPGAMTWTPAASPPAAATPRAERFVLLRAGTTFYVTPSLDAAHAGEPSGEGDRGAPAVYRLLSDSGPWLEIQTVPEDDGRHCAPPD